VEIYAVTKDIAGGMARIKRFLADYHHLSLNMLEPHLYAYHSEDAIRHVFRVASSLDSMIVGEPQILGQIKTSYGYAAEFKSSGIILNRFLHKAFSVAKRVRTETRIASSAVSVSFAAVELAKKIFGDLSDKTVMLVGAGEMCELAAKHFLNNGVRGVIVTNRTFERAERLADELQGRAVRFEDMFDYLHQADIVLSSTGAPHIIIGPKDVEEVIRRRRMKPMFFIDIAVPRDIDPRVNDVENVYLYTVDDLQEVVAANLQQRGEEAKKAEEIVEQEIGQFFKWLSSLDITPTIVALRTKFDEVRRAELDKTLANWKDLPPDGQKRLEALTNAIMNKLLHSPTSLLKKAGQGGRSDLYVDALRSLFDLQVGIDEDEVELEE
jgi:glutamyl-tRNA reductase